MRWIIIGILFFLFLVGFIFGILHWEGAIEVMLLLMLATLIFCGSFIFYLRKSYLLTLPLLLLLVVISAFFYKLHWAGFPSDFHKYASLTLITIIPMTVLYKYQSHPWINKRLERAYLIAGIILFIVAIIDHLTYFYPLLIRNKPLILLKLSLYLITIIAATQSVIRNKIETDELVERDFMMFILGYVMISFFFDPLYNIISSRAFLIEYYSG